MRDKIANLLHALARKIARPLVYEWTTVAIIDGEYRHIPGGYYADACMDDPEVIEAVEHLWDD